MTRKHLFIMGRVQGVCFRMETRIRASSLGLTGFIKNLADGRVEAVIEGEEEKVAKLIKWIHRGPALAKVKDIQILDEDYLGKFKGFEVQY